MDFLVDFLEDFLEDCLVDYLEDCLVDYLEDCLADYLEESLVELDYLVESVELGYRRQIQDYYRHQYCRQQPHLQSRHFVLAPRLSDHHNPNVLQTHPFDLLAHCKFRANCLKYRYRPHRTSRYYYHEYPKVSSRDQKFR